MLASRLARQQLLLLLVVTVNIVVNIAITTITMITMISIISSSIRVLEEPALWGPASGQDLFAKRLSVNQMQGLPRISAHQKSW